MRNDAYRWTRAVLLAACLIGMEMSCSGTEFGGVGSFGSAVGHGDTTGGHSASGSTAGGATAGNSGGAGSGSAGSTARGDSANCVDTMPGSDCSAASSGGSGKHRGAGTAGSNGTGNGGSNGNGNGDSNGSGGNNGNGDSNGSGGNNGNGGSNGNGGNSGSNGNGGNSGSNGNGGNSGSNGNGGSNGGSGSNATVAGLETDGATINGDPLATDGGGTLTEKRSDLVIRYSAYTDDDGDSSSAQTMAFAMKGPNDADFVPLGLPAFVPKQAADGSITLRGACKCGAKTTFALRWHADGAQGAFDGRIDTDDPNMWVMSHNAPGTTEHWGDTDLGQGASGANVLYMAEDHNGLISRFSEACAVPYFYCGSKSHDHPWSYMDDIRLRLTCDLSNCAELAAGTEVEITGQAVHYVDPN